MISLVDYPQPQSLQHFSKNDTTNTMMVCIQGVPVLAHVLDKVAMLRSDIARYENCDLTSGQTH